MRVLEPKSNWEAMELYATPVASANAPWMQNRGWQWLLEDSLLDTIPSSQGTQPPSFMARHIELAKGYIASAEGMAAFGVNGYLPTAVERDRDSRNKAAWSMMVALHLLVEEQTLSVLSPEEVSPGHSDLRALLWQLARWLGWLQYEELYSLGLQADLDTDDSGMFMGSRHQVHLTDRFRSSSCPIGHTSTCIQSLCHDLDSAAFHNRWWSRLPHASPSLCYCHVGRSWTQSEGEGLA